jgi:hypothetical protein
MAWFGSFYTILGFVGCSLVLGKAMYSKISFLEISIYCFFAVMILSYVATCFYPKKWLLWGFLLSGFTLFFTFACLVSAFAPDGPPPFYHWAGLASVELVGGFIGSGISIKLSLKSKTTKALTGLLITLVGALVLIWIKIRPF